jgi:GDP-L-fucose synthase
MILVTGSSGFLGINLCNQLRELNIPFTETSLSKGTDLMNLDETRSLFSVVKPSIVINCAAFVGGIEYGYKYPLKLLENNILMSINLYKAASEYGVKKIINPISNCVYPKNKFVFIEEELWDGELHESVEFYGFSRKTLLMLSKAYKITYGITSINLIMSNMYGPHDHFDESRSHALGALISKIHQAKLNNNQFVDVWGSGKPIREWLYVSDAVDFLVESISLDFPVNILNIGHGIGISIIDLASKIQSIVGFKGTFKFDVSKPDGAVEKTMDSNKSKSIFKKNYFTPIDEGIKFTYEWYKRRTDGNN